MLLSSLSHTFLSDFFRLLFFQYVASTMCALIVVLCLSLDAATPMLFLLCFSFRFSSFFKLHKNIFQSKSLVNFYISMKSVVYIFVKLKYKYLFNFLSWKRILFSFCSRVTVRNQFVLFSSNFLFHVIPIKRENNNNNKDCSTCSLWLVDLTHWLPADVKLENQ